MMVGAEGTQSAGRETEDRARFAVPRAFAVRPRGNIDRVLEDAGHRAVVLWRDEQNSIRLLDATLEILRLLRRIGIEVLVVMRHLADLDDLELQRRRRHRDHRLGHLAVEGFLAQAAYEDRYIADGAHALPFAKTDDGTLGGGHAG